MKVIDMTPLWEDILPFLLNLLKQEENGVRDFALGADCWTAHCKEQADVS